MLQVTVNRQYDIIGIISINDGPLIGAHYDVLQGQ